MQDEELARISSLMWAAVVRREVEQHPFDGQLLNGQRKRKSDASTVLLQSEELSCQVYSKCLGNMPVMQGKRKKLQTHVPKPAKSRINWTMTTRSNPFEAIPDEMVHRIFGFLSQSDLRKVALTCERFQRIASDSHFWHCLNVDRAKFDEQQLLEDLAKGPRILSASISQGLKPLPHVIRMSPLQLQYLDLTCAHISDELLRTLLYACTELRKLSLESQFLDHRICHAIGRNPDLNTLNLCMTDGLDIEGLRAITKGCTKLRHLNVSWTGMWTDCLDHIVASLPEDLRSFNIAGNNSLTEQHLKSICSRYQKLDKLCISDSKRLTQTAIEHLMKLKNLRYLDFSRCYNLMTDSVLELADLPKLRHIFCYGLPDDSFVEMLRENMGHITVNDPSIPDILSIARPRPANSDKDTLWGVDMYTFRIL